MTDAEKFDLVRIFVNNDNVSDEVIETYIALAAQKIIARAYPFGTGNEEVPAKYDKLQCELAARLIFKRGFEGETVSIENGVHRHFGSANEEDLISEVMQIVGVM